MKTCIVHIDFSQINSHNDLVGQLSSLLNLDKSDFEYVEIDFSDIPVTYPDYLTLIFSVVFNLIEQGIKVHGTMKFMDVHSSTYSLVNKIDFSSVIGFHCNDSFKHLTSKGYFIEIKQFSDPLGALNIHKEIMKMLIGSGIKDEVLSILEFCLWELIDNALNHSVEGIALGVGKGLVSAQFYPNKKVIRILIADNGCGIYMALTKHPASKYNHYTETEALLNCINKGVTNGTGVGFGLWAIAKFVELNKGNLCIHSGGKQLHVNRMVEVSDAFYWHGTYAFLEINTDVLVNSHAIFGHEHIDFYHELKDELFENLIDLW